MQNAEALTGQQIDEFLAGSEGIGFSGESRAGTCAWTERLLVAQEFAGQSKKRRGRDPELCEQSYEAELCKIEPPCPS
jgi:hypothetical protein